MFLTLGLTVLLARPAVLTVGDGKAFTRIEEAVSAAKAGDTIEVYPAKAGYPMTAVRIAKPRLRIRGVLQHHPPENIVRVTGEGYEYSGEGSVPRAIFQIDPGGDGTTIEWLDLIGAHNKSSNAAGVRINQARNVTIKSCVIRGNDMGIMSNGKEGDMHAAENQLITGCIISKNGTARDPGYNHNLYLGGTSATVEFCNIHSSLTGHNLKSRAHFTLVRYCRIEDSANRELDFVDAWDTERPHSNAVLIGNVIQKITNFSGNRNVIHFGRERGTRKGTLFLANNTIQTAFYGPLVSISTPDGGVRMFNNVIVNTEQAGPMLVDVANPSRVEGSNNWISSSYRPDKYRLSRTWLGKDSPVGAQHPNVSLNLPAVSASYLDGEGKAKSALPRYRFSLYTWWTPSTLKLIGAG